MKLNNMCYNNFYNPHSKPIPTYKRYKLIRKMKLIRLLEKIFLLKSSLEYFIFYKLNF